MYKSDISAQASESVGDTSRYLVKAVIASVVLPIDFNNAMRRFDTGYTQLVTDIITCLRDAYYIAWVLLHYTLIFS